MSSMETFLVEFTSFAVRDIIDIIIVATLIYFLLLFIKETKSFAIFSSIVIIFGISYLSQALDLTVTQTLVEPFLTFFILILVIVFQKEIKRFFEWFSLPRGRLALMRTISAQAGTINKIVRATEALTKRHLGAIIVFAGRHPLETSIDGGIELNGDISVPLLVSIFDTKTPGHDGAVIIKDGKITHFGVHLPLSENIDRLTTGGTRHRAAIGITEENDCLAVVVSEERGVVSIAQNGELKPVSKNTFHETIKKFIESQRTELDTKEAFLRYLIKQNAIEKISALFIALILWRVILF